MCCAPASGSKHCVRGCEGQAPLAVPLLTHVLVNAPLLYSPSEHKRGEAEKDAAAKKIQGLVRDQMGWQPEPSYIDDAGLDSGLEDPSTTSDISDATEGIDGGDGESDMSDVDDAGLLSDDGAADGAGSGDDADKLAEQMVESAVKVQRNYRAHLVKKDLDSYHERNVAATKLQRFARNSSRRRQPQVATLEQLECHVCCEVGGDAELAAAVSRKNVCDNIEAMYVGVACLGRG